MGTKKISTLLFQFRSQLINLILSWCWIDFFEKKILYLESVLTKVGKVNDLFFRITLTLENGQLHSVGKSTKMSPLNF